MPEATMNEDDLVSGTEDNVGLSGQVASVQPITIPHTMEKPSHQQFGSGVATLDRPHGPRAQFGRRVHARRIGVGFDSRWMVSWRTIRVVLTVSASWWATLKVT